MHLKFKLEKVIINYLLVAVSFGIPKTTCLLKMNSPEDVKNALENGTFYTTLMADTHISAIQASGGKTELTFEFPVWFNKYITKESQAQIIAKIKQATPEAFAATQS